MNVYTISGSLQNPGKGSDPRAILETIAESVTSQLNRHEVPLRFSMISTTGNTWQYELEVIKTDDPKIIENIPSLFSYRQRKHERCKDFNIAFLIPTGIDCAIGGHAGDAAPAARLLASVADNIILHPNAVNASDINEQPENALYVEGSMIARLLMGEVSLRKVRSNRILVVTENRTDSQWPVNQVINSANAANAAMGTNCTKVVVLEKEISMAMGYSESGRPNGTIDGLEDLLEVLEKEKGNYDAVALATKITPGMDIESEFQKYFQGEGPNPWGGVEAALTHTLSFLYKIPSAHAPTMEDMSLRTIEVGVVDPRKAAETISTSYMFCILKGLHQAPQLVDAADCYNDASFISAEDVSCLVIPDQCIGIPTLAALMQGITVIAVKGNGNLMQNDLQSLCFQTGKLYYAENYLEAAGLAAALKKGIHPAAVLRPLAPAQVEYIQQTMLSENEI